jgi:hypothetical protein
MRITVLGEFRNLWRRGHYMSAMVARMLMGMSLHETEKDIPLPSLIR